MNQCFYATTRVRPRTFRIFNRRYTTATRITTTVQDDLRQLMVHCAQPVAIITTQLPENRIQDSTSTTAVDYSRFHGATISSFSSIGMHPYPMISFSLQLPSRLAAALRPLPSSSPPTQPIRFVVNILSATQISLAKRFAQRDPFQDEDIQLGRGLALTKDGQPMLLGCLGNITCTVVRSIPLDLEKVGMPETADGVSTRPGQTSELFIGKVVRVEQRHYGPIGEQFEDIHTRHEEPVERRPMVYYQKEFLTVGS